MKIGILCYPTFGGSGVLATELGKMLAERGHKVHFISYSQPVRLNVFSENIFYHEVHVPDYPLFDYLPYELALTSKLVDVIRFEELDLLHVHYAIPHAYAAFMAKQILGGENINIPVITTLHGTDITLVGRNPSYKPAVTFSINKSDYVTSVSESLKQDTLSFFNVDREIEVIPNFIDLSAYQGQADEQLRKRFAPNGERIIAHVSNFRKVKRVDDVLEIFRKVAAVQPSILLMIGDGPEREELEQKCRDYKICEQVHFLGKTKAVTDLLKISDLFLLPSATESFGLAALEAMASRVPVICSKIGGLPEVVDHGKSGFMAPVGEVDLMAQHALEVLSTDEKLAYHKAEAYKTAEKFDLKRVLPAYINLYEKALSCKV